MNKELKEQAHKEFDEVFWIGKDETASWKYEKQYKKYISLIDSLIDKTVQMTEDRIFKEIKQFFKEGDGYCDWMCDDTVCIDGWYDFSELFITNKSDINNNK